MSDRATKALWAAMGSLGTILVVVVGVTLWLGNVKANADTARAATDAMDPKVTRHEEWIRTAEKRLDSIDGKLDTLLRRVPPR